MSTKQDIQLFQNRSIIRFEGEDFFGKIGIDGRIFKALTLAKISVGIINQQANETGISVLVQTKDAEKAVDCLTDEFSKELQSGEVLQIFSIDTVSVITFKADEYDKISEELKRNKIFPLIVNQNPSTRTFSIVVSGRQDEKAKNIIESILFKKYKKIHLALFGVGNVGGTLIEQILERKEEIRQRKNLDLVIFCVANSKKILLNKKGISEHWRDELNQSEIKSSTSAAIEFAQNQNLENLILIDNTANSEFVNNYETFVEEGFDLVSSNKIFNTLSIEKYRSLREKLDKNHKRYFYETNVGAGLPLIDTIKLLHLSGENITRIKGVFSGSLSYIFNNFSVREDSFSTIIGEAMEKGFTEPDPREDLSGNDVARKLLILARELDLINEFSDINIQNLIPNNLLEVSKEDFISRLSELDEEYDTIKSNQKTNSVLRYVGDLHGDLSQDKGELDVKLISVPANSALGQLKGSDSIFEIYTESYGENPIVIMGAGAGAKVTSRGVFGDVLRLSEGK